MKKVFILFFVSAVFSSFMFSKDLSDRLVNHLDKSYDSSAFIAKNPTFYSPEFYFPELKKISGKILKTTTESYTLNEDGSKIYGDSDVREFQTSYYIFDKKGHITDRYFISAADDGYVYSKFHTVYIFEEDKYIEKTVNLKDNAESVIEYFVCEENDQMIFSKTNKNKEYKLIFNGNKILYQEYRKGTIYSEHEFLLNKNTVEDTFYLYEKENKIKSKSQTYENGAKNLPATENKYYTVEEKEVLTVEDDSFIKWFE